MAPPKPRPILIGASVAIALFLAACGGDSTDPEETQGPGGGATPIPTAAPLVTVPAPTILDTTGASDIEPISQDITYIVVAGNTLSLIAEQFDTTVDALIEANELPSTDIFIGQELIIPGGSTPSSGSEPTATPPPASSVQIYTVQPGDGGLAIAAQFGITLEALAAANGLSVDQLTNLQIGQELQIPGS